MNAIKKSIELFEKGSYKKALKMFNSILTDNPLDDLIWRYKGETLVKLGNFKEAVECYNKAIEILPEYNDSHSLMLIFSSIQEYLNKTKDKGKRQLRIKQINGVLLHSDAGRKYLSLIKDMQLDFLIQP